MSNAKDATPRIYVACLASYNAGILYGRWIEATADPDEMGAEIAAMLRGSPCPNVTVECPDCEGDGETAKGEPCPTCKGSGTVPSAEEWAIHDYEGLGADLGEYAGLEEVARRVSAIEVAEDAGIPLSVVLEFAHDRLSGNWDARELSEAIGESYRGSYDSWAEFAEEFCEEVNDMSAVPDWVRNHIDWESIGRDFNYSGDFNSYSHGREMFFFWAH